jgi:cytochrome c oxidase cbb3-type subunit 3
MTPPVGAATATADTLPEPAAAPQVQAVPEPEAPADGRLLSHSYDGIHEYDNPLPGWWSAIFIASIVFAAGYGIYYHLAGWGEMPAEKYAAALVDYEGKRAQRDLAEAANVSEDALVQRAADPNALSQGKSVFLARCASCHTEDGRGLIGPNLTDHYQLHGETRMDIYNTVRRGVPGTAMLAWGEQLPAPDVVAVAAFVATLRGQNIAGKAQEGNRVAPFTP